MFRKLHNSLNALLLASTACIVGALVLASLPPGQVIAGAQAGESAALATVTDAQSDAPKRGKGGSHLRRVTAMPYFSFLPRG